MTGSVPVPGKNKMSHKENRWKGNSTVETIVRWSLMTGLFFAVGGSKLQACGGVNPKDNPGLAQDCIVLLGMRDSLAGTASLNWDVEVAITDWQGIVISGTPGRVTGLNLRDNELTGRIPTELGRLRQLQELRLADNRLTGTIPAELSRLHSLQSLTLKRNQLTGEIPAALGQLTQLLHLNLDHNDLTGPIPAELGRLTRLQSLYLNGNRLTGPIPAALEELTHLKFLLLEDNRLMGEIPEGLGQLAQLRWLLLGRNRLRGEIPPELGQLSRLEWLLLDHNELTGEIPVELGQLPRLERLHLNHNRLTGTIPVELVRRRSQLYELLLEHNQLTGAIPAELGQLSRLHRLHLNHNRLTGAIPDELGRLSLLYELRVDHNRLMGEIPAGLGQLSRLFTLRVDANHLTGQIPGELGQLAELRILHLQNNRLTGLIPAALGQLSQLWEFSFRGNFLTGPVPAELSRLPDVYVLNLVARWTTPGQIKVTWDDAGGPEVNYEYRLLGLNSRVLVTSEQIPSTTLGKGEGITVEWLLTGLPTNIAYEAIELEATSAYSGSPPARARVSSPVQDPYCLPLWDDDPCSTAAIIPHVFMGSLGENAATAKILVANRDPYPPACDIAILFHRGTSDAPEILFDDQAVEGNLLKSTVSRGGGRILTLASNSAELVVGAISVFVRSPCSAQSLQVQGRYLVEDRVGGDIQELFSIAGQFPRDWLGDGDCQVLTGVFGSGRDLGFASVTAEPERSAPTGTQLQFRSFDLDGNPSGEPTQLEVTGEQTAFFPWSFEEPTVLEICLNVPESNSNFRLSTAAIGIVEQGGAVQWTDENFVDPIPGAISRAGGTSHP